MLTINLEGKNYNKPIDKKLKTSIIAAFEKHGLLKFTNVTDDFIKFVNQFTYSFANDAKRRKERMNDKNIRNVDGGKKKIFLHSEASFSPSQPEIVWFYCINPPETDSGHTLYCDGIELWKKIPAKFKIFFLENPILYKLKIPIYIPQKKKKLKRKWYLETPGVKNCILNYEDLTLNFDFFKFALEKSRIQNKFCFANHLFIPLSSEPQILKRTFLNNKNISRTDFKVLINLADESTKHIKWKKNELVMIDNLRYMHGRASIDSKESKRDVVVVQSMRSNFGYGSTNPKI